MPYVPEEIPKKNPLNSQNGRSRGDLFIQFKINKNSLSKLSRQKRNRIWQIITDTSYPKINAIDNIYETTKLDNYIKDVIRSKQENITIEENSIEKNSSESIDDSDDIINTISIKNSDKIITEERSSKESDDGGSDSDTT
jgi:hypothetical protein